MPSARLLVAFVAVVAAQEPEDADFPELQKFHAEGRKLQSHGHSSSGHGHSSGGGHGGGHGGYTRPADATQTGCTPVSGDLLPKTTASTPDALNEPCYIHDGGTCVGYMVCCVKIGTCISRGGITVSSTAKYYMGGCVSAESRAGAVPEGCAKQGECHSMYLEHMKGATTEPGLMETVSAYIVQDFMADAEGCESFWTPPWPIWLIIVIAVVAALVVVLLAVVLKMTVFKAKPVAAKGAANTTA